VAVENSTALSKHKGVPLVMCRCRVGSGNPFSLANREYSNVPSERIYPSSLMYPDKVSLCFACFGFLGITHHITNEILTSMVDNLISLVICFSTVEQHGALAL